MGAEAGMGQASQMLARSSSAPQPVAPGSSLRDIADRLARLSPVVEMRGDAEVVAVTADSREVAPGWLYCARRGARADGHDHAVEAVERGAAALLVERWLPLAVPQLRVTFARPLIGPAAAMVYGDPSMRLATVAVTGTNGKTTTALLARHALLAGGRKSGAIGTLGVAGVQVRPTRGATAMTTPDPCDLQATLAQLIADGFDSAVLEASSQGLDQDRLAGCDVALAIWLNLSPEHLDYHGTLEQYYASKARLFDPALSARGLICIDDEWGRRLAAQARIPITTFGHHPGADVRVQLLSTGADGTRVRITGPGEEVAVRAPVVGAVNANNLAAAYLAARRLGVTPADAARGIATAPMVPGRFHVVDAGQPFRVVIDYAHTPDALGNVLSTVRSLTTGQVHLVLGCRGGRDRYKRPAMGRAAAAGAQHVVFTSDNAGPEQPATIVAEMMVGAVEVADRRVDVEYDRACAITAAIRAAAPGDAVVVTGRGPERAKPDGRFGTDRTDEEVARAALAGLGYDAQPGAFASGRSC